MFGRQKRRERRLRERGLPAVGTITEVHPAGDGRWSLRLRVAPDGEAHFSASASAELPSGAVPAAGSQVEVLYEPAGRDHVVLAGAPSTAAVSAVEVVTPSMPPVPDAPEADGPLAAPDEVLRHLEDAARFAGRARSSSPVGAGGASPEMSVAQLAALAHLDADGVADEILRRIEADETTPMILVGEVRGLDETGRSGALAAIRVLHARGTIDDARMALVHMFLGVRA